MLWFFGAIYDCFALHHLLSWTSFMYYIHLAYIYTYLFIWLLLKTFLEIYAVVEKMHFSYWILCSKINLSRKGSWLIDFWSPIWSFCKSYSWTTVSNWEIIKSYIIPSSHWMVQNLSPDHMPNSLLQRQGSSWPIDLCLQTLLWSEKGKMFDICLYDFFQISQISTCPRKLRNIMSDSVNTIVPVDDLTYFCAGTFAETVMVNSLRPSDAYMRHWSNHHWLR